MKVGKNIYTIYNRQIYIVGLNSSHDIFIIFYQYEHQLEIEIFIIDGQMIGEDVQVDFINDIQYYYDYYYVIINVYIVVIGIVITMLAISSYILSILLIYI